ncbi:recombination protein F [Qipengyuania gaetbuli]|uniref:Recombination protein F n=1 Tax=Qipengyuania gaetbuli TaxID=266952 RepID=A0A844XWN6_9SPHN|nr:recombination protein F [Qipengyuania gaetbuli]MCA0910874.1 recombination protein F [Qipengyuania gaetbuli]MXO49994.1 recombination protein F [Qipengyuania gaetbuli]
MSVFDFDSSKAFAAVFALGLSALSMAFAIIPATPAGLVA